MPALLILLVSAATAVALVRPLRRVTTEHTLAGLYGDAPREALISRWSGEVVEAAERHERLGHFQRRLQARAWSGTTLRIAPGRGAWRVWRFSDGETWRVQHLTRPPRRRRRLIVEGRADHASHGLTVRAYVPGSHTIVLPVGDAHPVA